MSPRASTFRAITLALLTAAVLACGTAPARADVAFRQQTCKSQFYLVIGVFSMNKPAGVVSGDVMIATLRVSTFVSFNFSTPTGWTEITGATDNNAKIYYKVAGGSEPSSYSFGSMIGVGATMVGSIVAFSGADPVTPLGQTAKSTGSGTSVSFPTARATRNGSLRYSNLVTDGSPTAVFSGQSEACDLTGGGVSVANASAAVGAANAATFTASLSASAAWVAQSLIIQPSSPCTGGSLALTDPGTVSFPSTALNGSDRTITTSATIGINDLTDTALGWNLSATSTRFTNGATTLATTATTITGVSVTAGATNCGLPVSSGTAFPMTLPAGTVAPAATKIYSATEGSGLGLANLAYSFALAVPANTRIGTYTSTWTFTLASGP